MKKTTLVLGASVNTERYSNKAIQKLKERKIETFAIGARKGCVLGVEIETEKRRFIGVHTVTLYLNPARQKEYYQYIVRLKPIRVIFNPGTENDELVELLNENEIEVEIACTLVLLNIHQY
jgi:predicted CoA-binding protein